MIVKKLSEITPYEGFNRVETAILQENLIDMDKFNEYFPDYKDGVDDFTTVIRNLSKLKMTDKFVEYIQNNRHKRICIIGDYDVDGILATCNMIIGLSHIGVDCSFIIPNRLTDSYGITEKHIDRAISDGAEVLITVDNGIGCKEAVEYAKSKGLDVIITDHHIPVEESVPTAADLIVDAKYNDDEFVDICGATVAFKLMLALLEKEGCLEDQEGYFAMVEMGVFGAIATISDMMPEIGENRLYVRSMLSYVNMLKEKNIWGGRILKMIKGLGGSFIINNPDVLIDEDSFGFFVAPTMNAYGRVKGDVEKLVLDILNIPTGTVSLNEYLQINRDRKAYTIQLTETHIPNPNDVVNIEVFDQNRYQFPVSGLLGLVANKMLSAENKVSLAGTVKGDNYEFSCRSPQGYSIHDGFMRIKEAHPELGLDGGGHESAMGMKLKKTPTSLKEFKQYLSEDFNSHSEFKDKVVYEYEPDMKDEIVEAYRNFSLFGPGFKKIKFKYNGSLKSFDQNNIKVDNTVFEYHVPATLYYASIPTECDLTFDVKFSRLGAYYRVDEFNVKELDSWM